MEPAADVALLDAALVVLRVDHEDAGPADDEVVDVRPGTRDAAVVKHGDPFAAELIETAADHALSLRASFPRGRRVRIGREGEYQAAKMLVLGADAFFPALVAALPLACCRTTCITAIQRSEPRGRGKISSHALLAGGGTSDAIPTRPGAAGQRGAARPAGRRTTQPDQVA